MSGSPYCFFHRPEPQYETARLEARRKGGLALAAMLQARPVALAVDFSSADGVVATLTEAARLMLRAELDWRRFQALCNGGAKVLTAHSEAILDRRLAEVEKRLAAFGEEGEEDGDGV